MGSRLAARRAGHIPKNTPTRPLNTNASPMAANDTLVFHEFILASTTAPTEPSSTPTVPPSKHSTSASTRNCVRITLRVAPSALRIPISRVRSVTDTSTVSYTHLTLPTSDLV